MILEPLREMLLRDPDVYRMVGERIYPVLLPTTPQLPAIRITGVDEQTDSLTLVHTARVQLSCFGLSYADTTMLAHRVRTALLNRTGVANTITILTIESAGGGMDTYEADTRRYHTSEDVWVIWRYT
ncbi:MAG TPA: hypothetical protein O0W89_04425 [Methanocorpusculum sp.]|nr:hypothetical protein [Methanocorpusculum sp.]